MLIVEGSFSEQIEELVKYLDFLKGEESISDDSTKILEDVAQENKTAALEKLVKRLPDIAANSSEKDYEPIWNLVISVILSSDALEQLAPELVRAMSLPPQNSTQLIRYPMAILSNFFNLLPAESPIRFMILQTISILAVSNNQLDFLKGLLIHFPSWLEACNASSEQCLFTFNLISDALSESKEYNLTHQFLEEALKSAKDHNDLTDIAIKIVLNPIQNPTLFKFDSILGSKAVQILRDQNNPAYQLLQIFLRGSTAELKTFLKSNSKFIQKYRLDESLLSKKIQLLTLATIAADGSNRILTYEAIEKELGVSPDQIDNIIIEGIRFGIVEGKISQLSKEFIVYRTLFRVFEHAQWQQLDALLTEHKSKLQSIISAIQS